MQVIPTCTNIFSNLKQKYIEKVGEQFSKRRKLPAFGSKSIKLRQQWYGSNFSNRPTHFLQCFQLDASQPPTLVELASVY